MVDSPTTNYGLREQELGSNVATWGDPKLNEVLEVIDQILGTVKGIAITGDYTITSTNYVTTADNKNAGWRFTGTLAANATITVPATNNIFIVDNSTTGGFSTEVKTSAGTGITVPNGRVAWLRCNGTNVVNAFPTHMGTDFTPSLPGDATNVQYVLAQIAGAVIPGAAGTIKVDAAATAGYAIAVLLAGTGINISDDGDTMTWSVVTNQLEEFLALTGKLTATVTSGTTAATDRRRYKITGGQLDLPTMVAGSFVIVEMSPSAGTTVTVGRNSQTIDGVSEDDTWTGDGGQGIVATYTYGSAGAVLRTDVRAA